MSGTMDGDEVQLLSSSQLHLCIRNSTSGVLSCLALQVISASAHQRLLQSCSPSRLAAHLPALYAKPDSGRLQVHTMRPHSDLQPRACRLASL